MKRIQPIALAMTLVLALGAVAMGAPKNERARKNLKIEGKILHIDQNARTLLVADQWSDKLYLVNVPKDKTFKITFGMNMKLAEAELWQAHKNDRVILRCTRVAEHLARLDDGRQVAKAVVR